MRFPIEEGAELSAEAMHVGPLVRVTLRSAGGVAVEAYASAWELRRLCAELAREAQYVIDREERELAAREVRP